MYLTNLAIKKENGMTLVAFVVIIAILAIPILSTININMRRRRFN